MVPKLYLDPTEEKPYLKYVVAGPNYSWYLLGSSAPMAPDGFGEGGNVHYDGNHDFSEAVDLSEMEAYYLTGRFLEVDQEPALKAWIDAKRAEAGPPEQRLPAGALDADGDQRTITLTASPSGGSPFLPAPAGRGVRLAPPTPGQCLDALVANLMAQPAHLREPLLELAHAAVREDPSP